MNTQQSARSVVYDFMEDFAGAAEWLAGTVAESFFESEIEGTFLNGKFLGAVAFVVKRIRAKSY